MRFLKESLSEGGGWQVNSALKNTGLSEFLCLNLMLTMWLFCFPLVAINNRNYHEKKYFTCLNFLTKR